MASASTYKFGKKAGKKEKTPEQRIKERLDTMTSIFKPKGKIRSSLDVGCADAVITQGIAEAYGISQVYGNDVRPATEFKQPTKFSHIVYRQTIDNTIDIPTHSVDLVTCFVVMHHFDDFDKMMTEICRILKPRGYFYFREHDVDVNDMSVETYTLDGKPITTTKKDFLDQMHAQWEDHCVGCPINYFSRLGLKDKLEKNYAFRHLADSDYTSKDPKIPVKNPQALYHSLYLKL